MEIQVKVAEKVSGSNDTVKQLVIDKIANAEINVRVDLCVGAIDKIKELDKDIKKINPDQISLNEKGEEVAKSYSKTRYEEKKKKEEEKAKWEKALEKALEKGDYSDLKNLTNK